MINFDGMKAEAQASGYPMLPAGPYVGKILNVKIDGEVPNQVLVLRLDVTEGEYKDYFTKRYTNDKESGGKFEAKYRGDLKLHIPHPNSSRQWPETDKRRLNDALYRVEQSNPGYHFDGDERTLVGKTVGFSMQEGMYNDKPFTTVARLETADDVKKGLVSKMKPKKPGYSPDYQAQHAAPATSGFTPVEDSEIEIPF